MSQDRIQALEENIRKSREHIALFNALERLLANQDFCKVIKEGYLKDEAVRLVHLRGDPFFRSPERQLEVMGQIDGISHLAQYLRMIGHSADMAEKTIASDEATRDELQAGDE